MLRRPLDHRGLPVKCGGILVGRGKLGCRGCGGGVNKAQQKGEIIINVLL